MGKRIFVVLCIAVAALVLSCRPGKQGDQVIDFDSINYGSTEKVVSPLDTVGEGLPIFYNMYLSVELSSLFETAGAVYTPELMNNPDKTSEYLTSSQQAVNLGIYAVDLSYARVFDQVETASRYFGAMQQLSKDLGIPSDYFENTAQRFERNLTNKDSLIALANEVYYTTEDFLKANERFTTAAIIILGGWVEAISIAINVAIESRDPDIIERLIDQKYSLNNLILMLSEHKENEVVASYLSELAKFKKAFNDINVVFDVNFDPETDSGNTLIETAIEQIEELQVVVQEFRQALVS